MPSPDPDDSAVWQAIDEAERRRAQQDKSPPPTSLGIAFRFTTEMVAALLVGGGLGWSIDWAPTIGRPFTRALGVVVFFVLGAAAEYATCYPQPRN